MESQKRLEFEMEPNTDVCSSNSPGPRLPIGTECLIREWLPEADIEAIGIEAKLSSGLIQRASRY